MGLYLKTIDGHELPKIDKAEFLKDHQFVMYVNKPSSFISELVVVAEMETHDAARYVKDETDFRIVTGPDDRKLHWLIIPGIEKRCTWTK